MHNKELYICRVCGLSLQLFGGIFSGLNASKNNESIVVGTISGGVGSIAGIGTGNTIIKIVKPVPFEDYWFLTGEFAKLMIEGLADSKRNNYSSGWSLDPYESSGHYLTSGNMISETYIRQVNLAILIDQLKDSGASVNKINTAVEQYNLLSGTIAPSVSANGVSYLFDNGVSGENIASIVLAGAVGKAMNGKGVIGRKPTSGAENSVNKSKLNSQLVGKEIAGGHAYDKHVIKQGEFKDLGITTKEQFASHIEKVVFNPTSVKELSAGRKAYWDQSTGTVVIRNPKAKDGGTAFRPIDGRKYFEDLN